MDQVPEEFHAVIVEEAGKAFELNGAVFNELGERFAYYLE